jgi:hypothetical protein
VSLSPINIRVKLYSAKATEIGARAGLALVHPLGTHSISEALFSFDSSALFNVAGEVAVEAVTSEPLSGQFSLLSREDTGKSARKGLSRFHIGQEELLNQRLAGKSLLHRTGNSTDMFRDRRNRICELPTCIETLLGAKCSRQCLVPPSAEGGFGVTSGRSSGSTIGPVHLQQVTSPTGTGSS